MTRVQPKAMPNWCLQVKPDEPWTGRCGKEKIAATASAIGATKRRSTPTPCMPASAVWSGSSSRRIPSMCPAAGHGINSLAVPVSSGSSRGDV